MKRIIFLTAALILALSISGCAYSATVQAQIHIMDESAYPPGGDEDYDSNGNVKTTLYRETLEDALYAADGYVSDNSAFSNPVIIIDRNETLSGVMELSDTSYENLSTVTIQSGRANTIEIANEGERHFLINGFKPQLTFSGITFAGSTGNELKGGIEITSGTVNFNGVTFSTNGISGNGGALSITGGTVNFTGTNNFTGNLAENGGALSITGGFVTLTGTFTGNTSNVNGGALYLTGGTLTFGSITMTGNTSTGSGGGIYANGITAALPESAVFTSNTAGSNGGAIALAGGSLTLSGSTRNFESNTAGSNGGAIAISGGELVLPESGTITFEDNKAPEGNGGAIYVSGSGIITADSSTIHFTNNRASWPTDSSASVTTDPSESGVTSGFGGAICMTGTETLNLGSVNFNNNKAAQGAGLYISGGIVTFSGSANFGNSATTSAYNDAYEGGALYASGGTVNFSSTASFRMNRARDNGGAIYATGSSTYINFTETPSFSGNTANSDRGSYGDGGAVWWGSGFSNFPSSAEFTSNTTSGTVDSDLVQGDAGKGGAVYISGTGTFNITSDLVFTTNTAFNKGGAVYSPEADIVISGIEQTENNNALNGSGGFVNSAAGTITITNSSISNQTAKNYGGAVYGFSVEITSSDFTGNSVSKYYGGAIFTANDDSGGTDKAYLRITNATFESNKSSNSGGAIGADYTDVYITNAYFKGNSSSSQGGAIYLENVCDTEIDQSTFEGNGYDGSRISTENGGAIRVHGPMDVTKSYFVNNTASKQGGAIYFEQYGTGSGQLTVTSSMFTNNRATGSEGGAIYLNVDEVRIEKTTFDSNQASGGTSSSGGGIYLTTRRESTIINCTFSGNKASGTQSRGGALTLAGTARTNVISCTFTNGNTADYVGGGIFVASSGILEMGGTIVVGNTAAYGGDICSFGTASSTARGYNRVASYYEGDPSGSGGAADWSKQANRADTDRSNEDWTKSTFFSDEDLDINEAVLSEKPPVIGSDRTGTTIRLLTIMLDEDDELSTDDRATNIIAQTDSSLFPRDDERDVDRWSVNTLLDIGAVMFSGSTPSPSPTPITHYTIESVKMSGIPNSLRSVGQSASLIALVRYTNGRAAYGGNGTNNEPVTWTSSSPNDVRVDQLGNVRILRASNNPVLITVSTVRNSSSGSPATDSHYINVNGQYIELNVLPQFMTYFSSIIENLSEYDLGLTLADVSSSLVSASGYQRGFVSLWDVSAKQITDLTSSSPEFDRSTSYNVSGAKAVKKSAAMINFHDRSAGDVFPLTYSWTLTGDEITNILGYSISDDALFNETLAEKIFSSLRVDFVGASNVIHALGGNGATVKEAYNSGSLAISKADSGKGVHIDLTAYLANVAENSVNSSAVSNPGSKLLGSGTNKLLTVPDGSDDGAIYGSMWLVQTTSSGNNSNSNSNSNNSNNNSSSNSSSGGGGGGGCNAFSAGMITLALFIAFRKR